MEEKYLIDPLKECAGNARECWREFFIQFNASSLFEWYLNDARRSVDEHTRVKASQVVLEIIFFPFCFFCNGL